MQTPLPPTPPIPRRHGIEIDGLPLPMAKMRLKSDLPTKTCLACGRPFAWRKKWARSWDAVKYCSKRCQAAKAAKLQTS